MAASSVRRHLRRRRPLGAAALAMIGLTVAACTGAASPTPSPAATATPTASAATPSPAATATPTASAAQGTGPCTATDIVAAAGRMGGAAGSRGADVVVSASGDASCRLPAAPVVAVVDAAGTELLRSQPAPTGDGPLISPTGSASFSFTMSNWCDASTPMPLQFRLGLAGGTSDIGGITMAAADLPPCNGPGQPASLSTTDWQQP